MENTNTLLFDLTACQPIGGTLNHGGKEYAEAVFYGLIRKNIRVAGFYNSKLAINKDFVEYCINNGGLIDINQTSLQDAINTQKYTAFYSSIPYYFEKIKWGNTTFLGNIHGLRSIEVFTDENEAKYALSFKKKIIACIKQFKFIQNYKINKDRERIGRILALPNFICITGSLHSKCAIMVNYPSFKADNIHVFYDPLIIDNSSDVDSFKELLNQKYYLLVSGNRWVKNTFRGMKALDELISSGQYDGKVVVTGINPRLPYLKYIKNKDSFVFKKYVETKELTSLYRNAYCLLFLSLSEGFGYPPLEAISRGVPVICSPNTALYEVYQKGVLYCNPYSILDIKTKIIEMEDCEMREHYIEEGKIRAKEIIKLQHQDEEKLVDFISSYV